MQTTDLSLFHGSYGNNLSQLEVSSSITMSDVMPGAVKHQGLTRFLMCDKRINP